MTAPAGAAMVSMAAAAARRTVAARRPGRVRNTSWLLVEVDGAGTTHSREGPCCNDGSQWCRASAQQVVEPGVAELAVRVVLLDQLDEVREPLVTAADCG